MTKNILVTGASGVIGLPLVLRLLEDNHFVTATYYSSEKSIASYVPIRLSTKLTLVAYSQLLFTGTDPTYYDEVWHFATYGQPILALANSKETIKLNISDIHVLITLLKPDGIFYYASTSEMYGDTLNATETSIPVSNPQSARAIYTESKRLGEALLNMLIPNRCVFLRICLVYSAFAKVNDTRVMFQLMQKAYSLEKINLLDSGNAIRQYCHVNDALKILTFIQRSIDLDKQKFVGVWNISNPDPVTIKDLAGLIASYLKVPLIIPSTEEKPVLDALQSVSIIPKRFLNHNPNFTFMSLQKALPSVIDSYILTLSNS